MAIDTHLVKQHAKQIVRRTVGEPYVGKRLKQRRLNPLLDDLGLQPRNILDAGAEDATFVYWLADRFKDATVTAVDIDEAAVAACLAARPRRYDSRVDFAVQYFADLEPESYDIITAFDVLEHIAEDAAAVADLYRALRPGGTMLVHVPRDQWIDRGGTIHRVPDDQAWKINPGHVRMGYSPQGMTVLLEDAGFMVEDVQTWVGRWGTLAFEMYTRFESPRALRLLSIPITDVCAGLDRRRPDPLGNTVFARAVKPA